MKTGAICAITTALGCFCGFLAADLQGADAFSLGFIVTVGAAICGSLIGD